MSRLSKAISGLGGKRFSPPSLAGIRARLALVLPVAAAILLAAAGAGEVPQGDLESTPLERTLWQQSEAISTATAAATAASEAPILSAVTLGLNFEASRLNVDSGFIPPDTMGAVGPRHIVEMINGNFQIWEKRTGVSVNTRSLNSFWSIVAGLAIPPSPDPVNLGNNFTFDPRIVFDVASGRWFAVSLDRDFGAGNNIFLARSDTDDPTGDWDGVRFVADTVGAPEFHDYETLSVDADGLYMCTQDFNAGGNESCYSIPKADLLLPAPSIANMTRFEATPAGLPGVNGSIQPALDFGPSDGRAPLLGVSGGALVRSDILGAGAAGAVLGVPAGIAGDPGHAAPPDARQPHPAGRTIENVAPRFVSNVIELGDSLWAVHAVAGSGANSALRWYEIDEPSNTVMQTGLIDRPDQDFHEPSIAADQSGNVLIGYTCSGPNLSPSTCVSVGTTAGGVTTFEAPRVLRMGAGHYWQDFSNPPNAERNRWGDYSATVIDPVYPCTFWTFQEFVAVSAVGDVGPSPLPESGQWGVQITELAFNPPVMTIPGDLPVGEACVGGTETATLQVCNTSSNTGVCANLVIDRITSSNPRFQVTTPSSGFPVVVSPDFCFPFQVRFTPTSMGSQSATLTIESNDPRDPTAEVSVTGSGGTPDVRVTGSSDFGDVCPGNLAEKRTSVCNVGACNLSVLGAVFEPPCPDFQLINRWFPATVSPDFCMDLIVRFTPTSVGPKSCNLVIQTNDPDTPFRQALVTANTPVPSIDVSPDLGFPPTVLQSVGACTSPRPFPVSNTGTCNLTISSFAVTDNGAEYSLSGLPSFPIILQPGHIVGEGDLKAVFAPTVLDRDRTGALTVTYLSDPITGATTNVMRSLCGEGVRTGARVLVRAAGAPLDSVESIHLQRIVGNRNNNILDTADVARNLTLQSAVPAAPCASFQYHREYGTVSNPIQLLPGSYQVTATAIVGGKRMKQSAGFDVTTCGFNPTIMIDF